MTQGRSDWERGYNDAMSDITRWVLARGDDATSELFAQMFEDIARARQREIQKIREEHGLSDAGDGVKERTN